jgi:hypothetical protein
MYTSNKSIDQQGKSSQNTFELNNIMKWITALYGNEVVRNLEGFNKLPEFGKEIVARVLSQLPGIVAKNQMVVLQKSIWILGASGAIASDDSQFLCMKGNAEDLGKTKTATNYDSFQKAA